MNTLPNISEAEYEVMKVIWKYAPINTRQVVEKLAPVSNWSPKTIQTMLLRLVKKGALAHKKEGRIFVYTPLIPRDEYRSRASKHFLDRFYDGALGSMVLNFIKEDQFSPDEIRELRDLLDGKDQENE